MYTKIRKEVFWSLLAKAVAFGLYIITNVVLARKLGVDLFGQLSYFLAVLNIALVISLAGFNESSQKYVAQYKDTQKLRGILNGTLIGRIIISGVCVVIFFIFKKEILFYFSRQVPMPFFVI
ncbi:MAG: oligosaccharide flippase family protein, partial [Candidatus Omnitrophica bacterium]|nr:oligosaccharide flippase family protein [Candidatus Omnitrophota bacterium]